MIKNHTLCEDHSIRSTQTRQKYDAVSIELREKMIVVKCKGSEAAMSKLAVHVAEQIEAVPVLKAHEFILTTTEDEELDVNKAIKSIKDFLKLANRENDFAVTAMNQDISITLLSGETLKCNDASNDGFFVCQHCGRMSFFEADHKDHEKMHYIGGA
ncbi:MAG: hypothetical protein KGI27_03065 [Thaumarchaeota archaeon]|nr:hypothetical protein [Nitrososphaerota archaeon]